MAGTDLSPFILSASVVIDQVSTCATAKGITLTSDELEVLERWLAAHIYCAPDRPYTYKKTGNAAGTVQGVTKMGLDSTFFGQTAKMLDRSGCLALATSGKRGNLLWMGKPPSEQIPYDQRD
jgi:hypothetical protein